MLGGVGGQTPYVVNTVILDGNADNSKRYAKEINFAHAYNPNESIFLKGSKYIGTHINIHFSFKNYFFN